MAIIIAIFCFFSNSLVAQKYNVSDSLIEILDRNTEVGESKLDILHDISYQVPQPNKKAKYADLLIEEAVKQKNYRYHYLGYISKGFAQKLLGNHTSSLEAYLNAVKIANQKSDSISLGDAYTNIASLYTAQEDYGKAIEYYKLVEAIYRNKVDPSRIAVLFVNYGYAAYKAEQFELALEVLNKASAIKNGISNRVKSYAKSNLALVLAKTNQIAAATSQLNEAVVIMENNQDYYAISDCLVEIGGVYIDNGQIELGIKNLEEGYNIAREHGLKQQIQNASKHLSEAYKIKGYIEKAFEYQSKYYAYRDSLMSAEKIRELGDLRTEFEVGQKQAEVDLLTAEKKTQKILLYASTGGAILLLALVGLIYKNNRDKTRINAILEDQKAQLEELNKTKDKFFSIISHDLRGPVHAFTGISRLIKYSAEDNDKEGLVEIAEHVEKTSKDLSGMLDGMLEWAMQQQGRMDYKPQQVSLKSIFEGINTLFINSAKAKNIQLQLDVDSDAQVWVDKNSTQTIFRNLVNNAIKFTPEGGSVTASVSQLENSAEIKITDTGIGIPKEKLSQLFNQVGSKSSYGTDGEKGLGLGLQLVYEFVKMNQGTIEVESDEGKGTTFLVNLPLYSDELASV
ncbi:tetratricopeptide repeat-containing sensor histidine kinase [Fulvivirga lutea]|uniref:histidine kinase n=1 Tax=Fulvivirga lutea TaxID=2810512 RepID=A0A975A343_9BACT|nr:tetratricopeptide repeat-containing sensor histidine kinase [Fulvivirga lutea]QSE99222.1 tetratricopeptide repeat-containing sensor histidine kinase [Fulvivirga lutea]